MKKYAEGSRGTSKYARKVEKRKRLAKKLGVPTMPLPILCAIQAGAISPRTEEFEEKLS